MKLLASFKSLKNPLFRRLYVAELVSLLGDAITWVGIALLAFQMVGDRSAVVLSIALTLRVAAFVVCSSYAGVLADQLDRKKILIITHLLRMVTIGLLAFVQTVYQIYLIVLVVNIFRSFFVPALKASIPQLVPEQEMYRKAISLYSGTYQVLGVLGPAVAGALAGWFGARSIFLVDAATFFVGAGILFTLPKALSVDAKDKEPEKGKTAPSSSPLTRSSTGSLAVRKMTGLLKPPLRRLVITSHPSFLGNITSNTRRSGEFFLANSIPCSPSLATSTSKPASINPFLR